MAKKIKTESDRVATPRAKAPSGEMLSSGHGQRRSLERGSATHKKNPGKRASQGG